MAKFCEQLIWGPKRMKRLVFALTGVAALTLAACGSGNQAFTALVDPISPPSATAEIPFQLAADGGGAGVLPPGSEMPIPPNILPT
jgi:hypothetical protein